MNRLRAFWRNNFDVREGEHTRTFAMATYFFFILCANNILKPVSWGLFLNEFAVDRLPYLYILIAVVGGILAYFYTKLAVRTSLKAAVSGATFVTVAALLGFWGLIDSAPPWILYVFSVFVSLFGIVFVSQGWLIAANLFDSREAKRLYGILGLGAIVGAAFGGSFTAFMAGKLGSTNLLPVAILVVLTATCFLHLAARNGKALREKATPKAREEYGKADFTFRDVISAVARYRHLLVIIGIISVTFLVEVLVEFQFNAMAKETYTGDELTAFLGTFSGVYLSITTFVLQTFFTTLAVGRLGVGRTLLISPAAVGLAAGSVLLAPRLLTAAMTRLFEASTRYSINRTAIELLYLPLPTELKNRTKAFVDVFVDRLGRGVAALLLLVLMAVGASTSFQISLLIVFFSGIWVLLALRARKEYMKTVRSRVESRRLDIEDLRVTVQDTETVELLEQVARGTNDRQVVYALSLLQETPGYDPTELLKAVAGNPSPVVRAKVYRVAAGAEYADLLELALAEVEGRTEMPANLAREAVSYAITVTSEPADLAARFLEHPNTIVAEAALQALFSREGSIHGLVTRDWLVKTSESVSAEKRALSAFAVGLRGDEGTAVLHHLLEDDKDIVIKAACQAAGRLKNRDYLDSIVKHLANSKIRASVVDALVSYGEEITDCLGECLKDESLEVTTRRRIPRVLAGIPAQRSVDILRDSIGQPNLVLRNAVIRGLSRLREAKPDLDYGRADVRRHIREEAQSYFELYAALTRFRERRPGGKATELLVRSVEERLDQTIERLFRLLGLRYPQKEINAAFQAVNRRESEQFAAALEFLDEILDNDLKVVLLPLMDGSPHLLDIGREEFGVKVPSLEEALREQIHSGDMWLCMCAIATSAELRMKGLIADIAEAAKSPTAEVVQVARSAANTLA